MEKNKKPVTIAELDVQPLSDEDLADLSGAQEVPYSTCYCIYYRTDYWDCWAES